MLFRFQIDPDDSHKDFKRLERWLCARPTDYQGLQYSTLVISEYKNPFVNLRWWELWIKMSCNIFFILLWYWISRTMCARFYLGFCIFYKNLLQIENKRQITFLWHELWENRWIFFCVESTVKLFLQPVTQTSRLIYGSFTETSFFFFPFELISVVFIYIFSLCQFPFFLI